MSVGFCRLQKGTEQQLQGVRDVMQAMKVLCRKLRSALLFFVAVFKKIFCFCRRRKKSEEDPVDPLPYSVVVQTSPANAEYRQWGKPSVLLLYCFVFISASFIF